MRTLVSFAFASASLVVLSSACALSTPAVRVELESASFATSGGNLFNCGSPAQPATPRALTTEISCEPEKNPDGTFSTKPVAVTQQMGCGDGNSALVTVVCQGTGKGMEVSGSVTIALGTSCNTDSTTTAQSGASPATFAFQNLGPAAVQTSSPLESCAAFTTFCTANDACAFNSFAATVSVTNTTPLPH